MIVEWYEIKCFTLGAFFMWAYQKRILRKKFEVKEISRIIKL